MNGPGICFVIGSWALRWAYDKGCRRAELLAVDDSPQMHAVLVALYRSFGFSVERYVGEESISDRLVWGAVGSLMSLDLDEFMRQWTPKLKEYDEDTRSTVVQR